MADGSPLHLPFPSPSVILGLDSASADEPAEPPEPPPPRPKKHAKRPSNSGKENTKRAAARKGPTVDEKSQSQGQSQNAAGEREAKHTDLGQVKPKQTKSRNGCSTCKLKRLKCGEEKPGCLQCAKRNIPCGGYKKTYQWREFGSGPPGKPNTVDKARQATFNLTSLSPTQGKASASTSPISEVPSHADARRPATDVNEAIERKPTPPPTQSPIRPRTTPSASASPHTQAHERQDSKNPIRDGNSPGQAGDAADTVAARGAIFNPDIVLSHRTRSFSSANGHVASPSLTYLEAEMFPGLPDVNSTGQDFVPFSLPQDLDFPYLTSGNDPTFGEDMIDLIGPIQPTDFALVQWPSQFSSPNSPFSLSTPENQLAFWNSQTPPFYQQPDLTLPNEDHLLVHFDQVTCGILSVINGPHENPWRKLILPLAEHSLGLTHAIKCMTAFHIATDFPDNWEVGCEHKSSCHQHMLDGLRDDSMGRQTQIATMLALAFAESWDQRTTTGVAHIKGAAVKVKEALHLHSQQPLHGVDLSRLKFLCNVWVYLDVIARLTGVDCDEKDDFEQALWTTDDRELVPGNVEPGFGIDFGMPIDARLDPLMGCAGTLFPIIGHVANLVRKVCRSQRSSLTLISNARDLMDKLRLWQTPAYIERPEDPATDVRHALQTAEAYRYATMLHLHQAVPELPSEFSDDNYAQRVLQYLATVPLGSGMLSVHIYPLMVAGCMASEAEDRDWVRGRWDVMRKRMRIGVIDKCLAVTEEVWRRKDDYEARSPRSRQRNLVPTADLSPDHQRARRPPEKNGSQSPEPGRAGMIFSFMDVESESKRPSTMDDRNFSNGKYDVAYTVRGHLHWIGVMWDWGWEVLLG